MPFQRIRPNDWANWRGPHYNGSSDAKNLPTTFSAKQNLHWSTPLDGPSAATPIVVGDAVYTTAADLSGKRLMAYCLERKSGRIVWKDATGSGYRPAGEGDAVRIDERGNYAAPSPVSDGQRVVFFFGNGDLAAYDRAGKKLWQRNIQRDYGDFCFNWTFSSSPQLWGGKLYLQVLQRNQPVGARGKAGASSFLLALDPANGRELWRRDRSSEASMESRESYATPIPYTHNGRKELLLIGGDVVTGHDPATGAELWRWGTWNEGHRETWWRHVPSPVAGDGVVLVCAPKRAPVYAAKLGGKGESRGADGLAWRSDERGNVTSDVPTPLFWRGKFYILSDVRRSLSCVDPRTGNVAWSVPVPGRSMCWGSPTGADGKIYAISLTGVAYVFDAANGRLLAENSLDEEGGEIRSTIAAAYDSLFVRLSNRLCCFGS